MAGRVRLTLNLEQVTSEFRAAAAQGLLDGMEHVLAQSTALVPLDEGPLQHSGTASVDPSSLRGAVAYDTPYAVRQHEDMTIRHASGRQAKFLEQPLNSESGTVWELVAARIRRGLRS
ncbi:hypothetical protein [Kitasatospora sp. NPDC001132]